MKTSSIVLSLMVLFALAAPGPRASAQEPFYLQLEGRLPVPASSDPGSQARITFRIADHPKGGRVLWSQGPVTVPLNDGHFSVTLGAGRAPLTLSLFDGPRWLRLECDGCRGRTVFAMRRRGRAVAIPGLERPSRPGPAAAKPYLRNLRLHQQRAYPTGIVPGGYLPRAYLEAEGDPAAIQPESGLFVEGAALVEGAWTEIGPSKVTGGQTAGGVRGDVSGRVNSIAVHPTNSSIAYTCGAQGGLWKTTDGGASWAALTESLPSLATGAVALARSDPDVIYLGTGEANFSIDSYWGAGIFKSTDAGASFTPTGVLDPNRAGGNASAVAALEVHPADPNLVVAAVGTFLEGNSLYSGGIYRSTDGGGSWGRVLGPGLPSGAVVGSDVRIDPADPNIVYAALGWVGGSANNGVYKSTDAGASFTKLDLGMTVSQEANAGRINLAVAPGNTQVLFAAVHNVSNSQLLGIWRSLDGGATWSKRNATFASCGQQCWYNMVLAVSPGVENTVFFGGVNLFRSTNGAQTFSLVVQSSGSQGDIHVDQHALTFSQSDPNQLWVGNDGGVWKTDGARGSTPLDWINANSNLGLLQFQSVAVPPNDPNIAYGGTQDNGTNKYTGSTVWTHSADGDGGQTAVDFIDPQIVYHTFYGVSFQRSDGGGVLGSWVTKQSGLNTGDRSQFYVPVEMDPTNPAVLYLGSYRLYRTANRADSWSLISGDLTVDPNDAQNTGNITAIGLTAADPNVIYVGSSNAQIQVTSNLGVAWSHRASPPLPNRFITGIAVHPADADTAWVAFSGFDDVATGNGHVFKTTDRGLTWVDATANLPDIPVNQLAIDPAATQMIYAVTDIGPYVSTNGGQSWRRYAGGFPNVATFEISVQQPNTLFAATHGRGMFQAFGCTASGTTDADLDGVADFCDNCAGQANAAQGDADADGYGPPCDCADADPARFPGAPEVCNGLDDDCDGSSDLGSAPPAEPASDLQFQPGGDLGWGAASLAEGYNLYRGSIRPGVLLTYDHTCLTPDIQGLGTGSGIDPDPGEAFYFVLSSENCLAESGVGSSSSGPRPNNNACP